MSKNMESVLSYQAICRQIMKYHSFDRSCKSFTNRSLQTVLRIFVPKLRFVEIMSVLYRFIYVCLSVCVVVSIREAMKLKAVKVGG